MSEAANYHTVFTVLQKSPPWQPVAIVIGIVIFTTIVAIHTVVRRKARLVIVLPLYGIFVLFAISVVPISGIREMYSNAKHAFIRGQYSVVEGTVVKFHPMPYEGHQDERFLVNGVAFSYSGGALFQQHFVTWGPDT